MGDPFACFINTTNQLRPIRQSRQTNFSICRKASQAANTTEPNIAKYSIFWYAC
jgi:hypothetical protein